MAVKYDHDEARRGKVVRTGLKPPSSNFSICKCPWCGGETKAFWWSLAGGGKKCGCGAKYGSELLFAPPKGKTFDPQKRRFV